MQFVYIDRSVECVIINKYRLSRRFKMKKQLQGYQSRELIDHTNEYERTVKAVFSAFAKMSKHGLVILVIGFLILASEVYLTYRYF